MCYFTGTNMPRNKLCSHSFLFYSFFYNQQHSHTAFYKSKICMQYTHTHTYIYTLYKLHIPHCYEQAFSLLLTPTTFYSSGLRVCGPNFTKWDLIQLSNFVKQLLLKWDWEVFTQVCGQTVTEVRLKFVDKGLVDQLLNRTGISDMSLWAHC